MLNQQKMGSPRTRSDRRIQKRRFEKNLFKEKNSSLDDFLIYNYYTKQWEMK